QIDETAQASAPARPTQAAPAPPPAPPVAPTPPRSNGEPAPQPALTSPSTRKLAHEMGVDLSRVQPTGDRGRITREDVVKSASAQPAAPAAPTAAPPPPPPPPPSGAGLAPAAGPSAVAELSQLIQTGGG